MTRVLCTARISNVESVLSGARKRKKDGKDIASSLSYLLCEVWACRVNILLRIDLRR